MPARAAMQRSHKGASITLRRALWGAHRCRSSACGPPALLHVRLTAAQAEAAGTAVIAAAAARMSTESLFRGAARQASRSSSLVAILRLRAASPAWRHGTATPASSSCRPRHRRHLLWRMHLSWTAQRAALQQEQIQHQQMQPGDLLHRHLTAHSYVSHPTPLPCRKPGHSSTSSCCWHCSRC